MKTNRLTTLVASLVTSTLASSVSVSDALAQPVSAASPTAVAQPTQDASAVSSDPNIDRAFLQPTAMTQPAGTITYNNYELILHGFTYAVTDTVQTTLTVLSPITSDIPFVGFGAVKWRLLTSGRMHLAVQGTLGFAHEFSSSGGSNNNNVYTFGAGGFATFCLREDCASVLSAAVNYQMAVDGVPANERVHMLIYGGSLVHRLGAHIKMLAEVTSAAAATTALEQDSNTLSNMSGVLVSYGLRFHTNTIAGDVGFIKPFIDGGDGGLLMGIPFINLSYRWQ